MLLKNIEEFIWNESISNKSKLFIEKIKLSDKFNWSYIDEDKILEQIKNFWKDIFYKSK